VGRHCVTLVAQAKIRAGGLPSTRSKNRRRRVKRQERAKKKKMEGRAVWRETAVSSEIFTGHTIRPTDTSADDFTARPMPQPEDPYPRTFYEVAEKFEIVRWDGRCAVIPCLRL